MCSMEAQTAPARAEAELAVRLAAAIEELAAAAGAAVDGASPDVASCLARTWAMVTAADPELAARAARYSST